jgi:hypothetical protein
MHAIEVHPSQSTIELYKESKPRIDFIFFPKNCGIPCTSHGDRVEKAIFEDPLRQMSVDMFILVRLSERDFERSRTVFLQPFLDAQQTDKNPVFSPSWADVKMFRTRGLKVFPQIQGMQICSRLQSQWHPAWSDQTPLAELTELPAIVSEQHRQQKIKDLTLFVVAA